MSPSLSGLRGLWRRSMIAWPDGARDSTTRVYWLQGMHACIDLRQPAAPSTAAASTPAVSLDELSFDQCRQLAQQQGFAGRLSFDGSHYEWLRSIDFQPASAGADAGSLHWDGDVLVETGRDIAYVEHWQREPAAPTLPWRIGAVLDPRLAHDRMTTMESAPNGAALRRRWNIIGSEGEFETACTSQAAGVAQ